MILFAATSSPLTTEYSSSVATMSRPSGEKKASSGRRKACPLARPPGCGNCHRTRPWGSTMSSRSFQLSAMRTSPGSTDGSEPATRCPGPRAADSQGGGPRMGPSAACAGTVRGWLVPTGRPARAGTPAACGMAAAGGTAAPGGMPAARGAAEPDATRRRRVTLGTARCPLFPPTRNAVPPRTATPALATGTGRRPTVVTVPRPGSKLSTALLVARAAAGLAVAAPGECCPAAHRPGQVTCHGGLAAARADPLDHAGDTGRGLAAEDPDLAGQDGHGRIPDRLRQPGHSAESPAVGGGQDGSVVGSAVVPAEYVRGAARGHR